MSGRTPGPWRYEIDEDGWVVQVRDEEGRALAVCACTDEAYVTGVFVERDALRLAHARLTADNARLRAVLQDIADDWCDRPYGEDPCGRCAPCQSRATLAETED